LIYNEDGDAYANADTNPDADANADANAHTSNGDKQGKQMIRGLTVLLGHSPPGDVSRSGDHSRPSTTRHTHESAPTFLLRPFRTHKCIDPLLRAVQCVRDVGGGVELVKRLSEGSETSVKREVSLDVV
jgi:hypothetical protein